MTFLDLNLEKCQENVCVNPSFLSFVKILLFKCKHIRRGQFITLLIIQGGMGFLDFPYKVEGGSKLSNVIGGLPPVGG